MDCRQGLGNSAPTIYYLRDFFCQLVLKGLIPQPSQIARSRPSLGLRSVTLGDIATEGVTAPAECEERAVGKMSLMQEF